MEVNEVSATEGPPLTTDDEGGRLKKEEFERNMEEARRAQNLPEGAVPEQRPIASQTVDDPHSDLYHRLVEANDPTAQNQEAMDKSAYDRAASKGQMEKAAKESRTNERMFPGARCVINKGPRENTSVAVNRVVSFKDFEAQFLGTSGVPVQQDSAEVAEYEVTTRDGRGEVLIVNADDLSRPTNQGDWGRSPI
jgi:hypothetical protein